MKQLHLYGCDIMDMSNEERADYLAAYQKHGHAMMESLADWLGIIGDGARKCLKVGMEHYSH